MKITELLNKMNHSGKYGGGYCSIRIHSDYSGYFLDHNEDEICEFSNFSDLQHTMNRLEIECNSDTPMGDITL